MLCAPVYFVGDRLEDVYNETKQNSNSTSQPNRLEDDRTHSSIKN